MRITKEAVQENQPERADKSPNNRKDRQNESEASILHEIFTMPTIESFYPDYEEQLLKSGAVVVRKNSVVVGLCAPLKGYSMLMAGE